MFCYFCEEHTEHYITNVGIDGNYIHAQSECGVCQLLQQRLFTSYRWKTIIENEGLDTEGQLHQS